MQKKKQFTANKKLGATVLGIPAYGNSGVKLKGIVSTLCDLCVKLLAFKKRNAEKDEV